MGPALHISSPGHVHPGSPQLQPHTHRTRSKFSPLLLPSACARPHGGYAKPPHKNQLRVVGFERCHPTSPTSSRMPALTSTSLNSFCRSLPFGSTSFFEGVSRSSSRMLFTQAYGRRQAYTAAVRRAGHRQSSQVDGQEQMLLQAHTAVGLAAAQMT